MAKKANSAFMKPLQPSDELSKVTGSKPLPRPSLDHINMGKIPINCLTSPGVEPILLERPW